IPAHHAGENRLAFISAQRLTRAFGDRRTGCVRLEASVVAALAASPGGIDRRMADLARHIGRSVIELSFEDQSSSDTGSQRHSDDVAPAFSGSAPELAERRAVRVVVQCGIEVNALGDLVAQWEVLPAEIRSDDDDAFLPIQRTWGSDSDSEESRPLRAGFRDRLRDHLLYHLRDPLDYGSRASIGQSRSRLHRDLAAAIERHRACNDVGSAEIHSDDETLLDAHTGTGGLRTSVSKLETYSGLSSRMQRQCPKGHRCGPWRSHGRQDSPSTPATACRSARGPNPNSGTVGPKMVRVGVPIADAR